MHYALILGLSFGIFFSILLITPFWLVNLGHFTIKNVGNFMFCATLSYVLGAVINVALNKRKSTLFIVLMGLAFLAFGSVIFLVNVLLTQAIIAKLNLIALIIAMLGIGMVLPASKAGAMLAREQYIGTAASVMKFIQTLGPVIFTSLAAYAIDRHNSNYFFALLVVAMILLGVLSLSIRSQDKGNSLPQVWQKTSDFDEVWEKKRLK